MKPIFLGLLFAFGIVNTTLARNQQVLDTAGPHQVPTTVPSVKNLPLPVVTLIKSDYDGDIQARNAKHEDSVVVIYPGNYLSFAVHNPQAFLNTKPTDNARVVLYVNGIEMTGICADWQRKATRLQLNSGQITLPEVDTVRLLLARNDSTKYAWHYFYSKTAQSTNNFAVLDASIGWQTMSALPTAAVKKIKIVYYWPFEFWAWLGVYLLILAGFIYLALRTNVLMDMTGIVTDPTAAGYDPTQKGVYSLSLTQLMFWTTLVIGAFIYCLVLTDMTSSLNPSVMLLIGISVTTTGIAYIVDSSFASANPTVPVKQHQSFFKDVLSDGTSYSVQRIQAFAWNLVLGLYFIIFTIEYKTMPEFSTTLLFLAGISSASYLGAKTPENNNAKAAAANPNP
ncbi:MAG: hypothetical protein ACHQHN_08185 [Sphingobacteriales bacterium]